MQVFAGGYALEYLLPFREFGSSERQRCFYAKEGRSITFFVRPFTWVLSRGPMQRTRQYLYAFLTYYAEHIHPTD